MEATDVGLPPGGVASALVAAAKEVDPRLPAEFRYPEAAVMRLAPEAHLLPCRSPSCCWRWATSQLVTECLAARKDARYLRKILEEELGDSAFQRLLNLQEEWSILVQKQTTTQRELEAERRAHRVLQEETAKLRTARDEALYAASNALIAQKKAEADFGELKGKFLMMEKDLKIAQARTPAFLQQKLQEAEEKLEQALQKADVDALKSRREVQAERDRNGVITVRLHELQLALENKRLTKKKKAQKKK